MFRQGTRVVIVDEAKARRVGARVTNGEKGTIGKPHSSPDYINVHMDGDPDSMPWAMSPTCVRRIHRRKVA